MKIRLIEGKGIWLAPILLVLFLFFIPISPSLKSIFFVGSILAIVLTPYYNQFILYACNTLWGRTAIALFAFIVIACLWSPAPYSDQLMIVEKYCKLIYLPILAVGYIHPKVRTWSINSYLAAMFLTCVISILKFKQIIWTGDPGEVFYNHIITGFMMAFAAYIAGLFVFKYQGWLRILYLFLTLLMSVQILFVNTGRTGYVVYFVLMTFLFVQKLDLKKAVIGLLAFSALIVVSYHESSMLQVRTADLVAEIKALQQNNKSTSIGFRIQFHDYAKSLWLKRPLTGIGSAGFKYSFYQDNPVPAWGREISDPHGQYWMTLAEQGLIGFVLLIAFLASLLVTSFRLSENRPILLGILISFCIGSFSDTILCYSTAGYLLTVMSALCFGELIEKHAQRLRGCSKSVIKNQSLDYKTT